MAASMKSVVRRTNLTFSVISTLRRNFKCTVIRQTEKQTSTVDVSAHSTDLPSPAGYCDRVNPPDKVSNIRKTTFHVPQDETSLQKELREKREETQEWHHQFWTKHNKSFTQLKDEFTKLKKAEKQKEGKTEEETTISAEEMSVFYKKFLDDNYVLHRNYNQDWHKKNVHLLWLAFRVNVEKVFSFRKSGK